MEQEVPTGSSANESVASRAASPLVRFLLETPVVRVVGRKAYPIYRAKLPTGDQMFLRSRFDWDASTLNEVYFKNIYERDYRLREGDVVIDVGAHIGTFVLKAARAVGPSGLVVGVEPASRNFGLLSKNVAENSIGNVKLVNAGLGKEPGRAELNIYNRGGENSLFKREKPPSAVESIEIKTLDMLAKSLSLNRVDFLKIDVEGFELEVLMGGKEVLKAHHPSLAMETHAWGPTVGELTEFLAAFGYTVRSEQYRSNLGLLYAR
jgi:FkbM family methyltransferase